MKNTIINSEKSGFNEKTFKGFNMDNLLSLCPDGDLRLIECDEKTLKFMRMPHNEMMKKIYSETLNNMKLQKENKKK